MTTENPIILLVDDSENDTLLMRITFENSGFVEPLRCVSDGEEAIAYLRGDGGYGDRTQFPFPTVVLLDLDMARKDGFDVLEWIRQRPGLTGLRVYILSASGAAANIQRAYALGANSYLVKPSNLDGLMHLAKCLVAWLKLSHFAPPIDGSEDPNLHQMRFFAMAEADSAQPERANYNLGAATPARPSRSELR